MIGLSLADLCHEVHDPQLQRTVALLQLLASVLVAGQRLALGGEVRSHACRRYSTDKELGTFISLLLRIKTSVTWKIQLKVESYHPVPPSVRESVRSAALVSLLPPVHWWRSSPPAEGKE